MSLSRNLWGTPAWLAAGWWLLAATAAGAQFWPTPQARAERLRTVWEVSLPDYGPEAYAGAVEKALTAFEEACGRTLAPGPRGRAGIKVYTNSGPGLGTPRALTAAVIQALERRGFARDRQFILDADEANLRACGYLPPLSRRQEGDQFQGVPVYPLSRGTYFDNVWYYDNPLPRQEFSPLAREVLGTAVPEGLADDRQSFLARPLLVEADFWINLPVMTDHPATVLNGCLANPTLWAISNNDRFFVSESNAPIAMAEIGAIPELVGGWACTLLSLERYQFIGGPIFNSLYTRQEPLLWLSANPVVLDAAMLPRLNAGRAEQEFHPLDAHPPALEYGQALGLGIRHPDQVEWIRLP